MSNGSTWREMYEHELAMGRMFDRKAKEAREELTKARKDGRFVYAHNWRVKAQEMRQKAVDARSAAASIKATWLSPINL